MSPTSITRKRRTLHSDLRPNPNPNSFGVSSPSAVPTQRTQHKSNLHQSHVVSNCRRRFQHIRTTQTFSRTARGRATSSHIDKKVRGVRQGRVDPLVYEGEFEGARSYEWCRLPVLFIQQGIPRINTRVYTRRGRNLNTLCFMNDASISKAVGTSKCPLSTLPFTTTSTITYWTEAYLTYFIPRKSIAPASSRQT
ncbi:hypothetical protein F4604DRAFT_1193637 [Suillus subluteus]|nr:hypothetical protein F4604DRAFT_1193637 [Suillus subluteus]